jgi:hypothetical protein
MAAAPDKRSRDAPADEAQTKIRKPTPEDFTPAAINRAVLKETVEHPATIYPVVAGSGIGVAMTLMVGATPLGLGLIVGGVLVGGTAWIINYVALGEKRAERRVARLREQLREAEQQEVIELSHECERLGFEAGAKRARKLTDAYQNLRTYLRENMERNGGQSLEIFRLLAESTHREGAALLRQAVDKFTALKTIDVDGLERELAESKRARAKLGKDSEDGERADVEIEQASRRIERFRGSEQQLNELLAEVKRVESTLQGTYLQLVDTGSNDPTAVLAAGGSASQQLETANEAARRAYARLTGKQDAEDKARDKEYLRAADGQQSE